MARNPKTQVAIMEVVMIFTSVNAKEEEISIFLLVPDGKYYQRLGEKSCDKYVINSYQVRNEKKVRHYGIFWGSPGNWNRHNTITILLSCKALTIFSGDIFERGFRSFSHDCQQMSYLKNNQTSVDANWNDRVLEGIQTRHGLGSKQEALRYAETHHAEAQSVLKDLVQAKYGSLPIPQNIQNNVDNFELKKSELKMKIPEKDVPRIHESSAPQPLEIEQDLMKNKQDLNDKYNAQKVHYEETSDYAILRNNKQITQTMIDVPTDLINVGDKVVSWTKDQWKNVTKKDDKGEKE